MALIKHSTRTVRRPCFHCGSTDIYWAHDTSVTTDKDGTTPLEPCTECGVTGKMVQIDANTDTQSVVQGGTVPESARHRTASGSSTPPPTPSPTPSPASMPGASKPAPPHATENGINAALAAGEQAKASTAAGDLSGAMEAFQTLASLFGPKIDTETIREMVRTEFKATVFPTRTVVVNTDGDPLPGEIPETSHASLADILIDVTAAKSSPTPMAVLMVGPAGSGKSTIARNVASALSLKYGEISLNPMLPVTSLLGYMNATGEYVGTVFRDIWENGGVFHADEFDNSHPSTMATLNAALAAKAGTAIAFPDGMVDRHPDFVFIASANTFGRGPDRIYVGRQQLDAATLNRFVIEEIHYDEALEHQMALNTGYDSAKAAEVLRYIRALRKNAMDKKMTVLVTPRNAVFACTLLKAGKSWKSTLSSAIRQGISDADWSKLTDGTVPPAGIR